MLILNKRSNRMMSMRRKRIGIATESHGLDHEARDTILNIREKERIQKLCCIGMIFLKYTSLSVYNI